MGVKQRRGSGKGNLVKGEGSGGETNWGGEVGKATWGSGKQRSNLFWPSKERAINV